MCNAWYSCFFCWCLLVLVGCERDSPSPVELKIDEEYGYSPIGDFSVENSSQPVHKISNNQTLFDVAYIYNIDPMNLAKINDIKPPYKVKNGQVLKLPNNKGSYSSISTEEMQKQPPSFEETDKNIIAPNNETKGKDDIDEQFEKAGLSKISYAKKNDSAVVSANGIKKETGSTVSSENRKTVSSSAVEQSKTAATKASKAPRFIMPVDGKVISEFNGHEHEGINIVAPRGSSVKAVEDGIVIYIGNGLEEDYGNVVIIQHNDELVTSYAHLESISVRKDARVKSEQIIGTVGSTGDVKEPQLYFEVLKNNIPVDPYKYLKRK